MLKSPDNPASKAQTWALFCALRMDFRNVVLTYGQAHDLLTLANADKAAALEKATAMGAISKGKVSTSPAIDYRAIFAKAETAGLMAGETKVPVPMIVSQHANVLDDSSPVTKAYYVPSGVCGFAWISIPDARSTAAKAAVKYAGARRDSYRGGVSIWVSHFGQSMEQKEAYAYAYAKVLCDAGIKAHAESRMD